MAGGFVAASGNKIKGGRWTVFRFFLVSVAFTSAWVAVSSQLGYYRHLHGPAVLLQLNIAYFLPSIPLLIVSAFLDKPLEARLGVAKTILVRLLVGLVGYGAICIWFPFMPEDIWFLLGAVVALGLFSGLAFSASYQLVARFANKNVIALGLGCSASGPLVLLLQLALEMGPTPTRWQQILLYETIALVILGGLWATASLLLRHWDSIETHAGKQELTEPLLEQQHQLQLEVGQGLAAPTAAEEATEEGEHYATPLSSPLPCTPRSPHVPPISPIPSGTVADSAVMGESAGGQLQQLAATVWKQRSLPPLVAYNSLEPYQTYLSTDLEVDPALQPNWSDTAVQTTAEASAAAAAEGGNAPHVSAWERQDSRGQRASERPCAVTSTSAPAGAGGAGNPGRPSALKLRSGEVGAGAHASGQGPRLDMHAHADASAVTSAPIQQHKDTPAAAAGTESASWQAFQLMWAPLAALSVSSTIALILFPLFTYVPTSGLLGESLPKVIFFVRIFADVLGRFLPRLEPLAAQSPYTPLALSSLKLGCVPLFLLYLKSPDRLHSDVAVVLFVTLVWLLGGYINTSAWQQAPRLVPSHLKGAAAGLMAIAYQAAHFAGLAVATLTALLMFGSIGVET